MKKDILDILNKRKVSIEDLSYIYYYPDIPNKKVINSKKSHNLDIYDEIFLMIDHTVFGSASKSSIITEKGISIVTDEILTPVFIK